MVVPPAGYLKGLRELCSKYDMLYISDEVPAFGRCGHWFASEDMFGIVPDIITFAKGITFGCVPLGGFVGAKGAYYANGYTYTGHTVSCAATLANIEVSSATTSSSTCARSHLTSRPT